MIDRVARNRFLHRLSVIDAGLFDVGDRVFDVLEAKLIVRVRGVSDEALDVDVVVSAPQIGECVPVERVRARDIGQRRQRAHRKYRGARERISQKCFS